MISPCKTELYLVVLYWNKVSSSNEMIAVALFSADDAQMIWNNTGKQFFRCKHTKYHRGGLLFSKA